MWQLVKRNPLDELHVVVDVVVVVCDQTTASVLVFLSCLHRSLSRSWEPDPTDFLRRGGSAGGRGAHSPENKTLRNLFFVKTNKERNCDSTLFNVLNGIKKLI